MRCERVAGNLHLYEKVASQSRLCGFDGFDVFVLPFV